MAGKRTGSNDWLTSAKRHSQGTLDNLVMAMHPGYSWDRTRGHDPWLGVLGPREMPCLCWFLSNFMSKPIDISKFDSIYAGTQKNIGPPGTYTREIVFCFFLLFENIRVYRCASKRFMNTLASHTNLCDVALHGRGTGSSRTTSIVRLSLPHRQFFWRICQSRLKIKNTSRLWLIWMTVNWLIKNVIDLLNLLGLEVNLDLTSSLANRQYEQVHG